MQEIYRKAAVMYRELVENANLDHELCVCANDAKNNGILKELLVISETQLGYKKYDKNMDGDGKKIKLNVKHPDYSRFYYEKIMSVNSKQNVRASGELAPVAPSCLSPQQWNYYSNFLTYNLPTNQMIKDFSTFIYCKLNHP